MQTYYSTFFVVVKRKKYKNTHTHTSVHISLYVRNFKAAQNMQNFCVVLSHSEARGKSMYLYNAVCVSALFLHINFRQAHTNTSTHTHTYI